MHTTDEQTLLKKACNIAVDLGKFRMAWIGIVDEKTKKVIPVAHAGEEHGYLSKIKTISTDNVTEGRGSTGAAFREGKYSVCNDIENNPKMTPWKKEALNHGYYSSIGLPIKKFGKVVGVFSLYASESNFFNDREIALLNEITGYISFALENFEKEELRKKAEAALTEKEFFLRESQKAGHIGSYKTDFISGYWQSSETLDNIFGIDKSYIRSIEGWKEIVHPDDQNTMDEYLRLEVIGKQKSFDREYRIVKINDKQTRWVHGLGEVKFDDSGNATQLIGTIQDITERKNAEEKTEKAATQLSIAAEIAKLGYWELDITKGLFTFTDQFYAIFKTTAEKVGGYTKTPDRYTELFVHPDDRAVVGENIAKAFQSDNPNLSYKIEHRITYATGETGYISVHLFVVKDEKGRSIKAFGVNQDITEQKKAEEAIIKERDLSDSIINSLPGIFFLLDEQGNFLRWNKNLETVTGYRAAEISQLHPLDLFDANEKPIVGEKIKEVFTSGRADIETHLLAKTKEKIPYFFEGSRITFENKPCLIGVGIDITERKKAEENLKQSEIRFRDFFESSPESLVVVDNTTLTFVKFNANAVKLFKYSAEEFIKIGPVDTSPLFQPDGRLSEEKAKELMMNLMKGDNPVFEWLILDATGKEIICEVRLTLLSNSNGSQHLASFVDITDRKNIEKKIEQQNKELATSNIELEQFAYIASHDLQEPLRMVSSFMNLLEKRLEGQLDDTNKQYIHFAVDGAKRMKSLILALLEYSRVGTNKEDFDPVDLNEVVQYVTNVLDENIKKNTALITFKFLPVITANKTLITHLFLNLVNNALKYHGDTKPEIEVGYSEDRSNYTIFVKDNGIGIDPKFFDKIFIIFQRLHNKDEYSGTGIGLAICKKIVEIHNGKIWVESEVGKGSTFYFSIPKQNA